MHTLIRVRIKSYKFGKILFRRSRRNKYGVTNGIARSLLAKNAIIQNRRDICEDIAGKYRRSIPHVPLVDTINVPVQVKSDGNCLFNSGSVLMTGNDHLSVELRLLTAAEIFLHTDYYAYHPR